MQKQNLKRKQVIFTILAFFSIVFSANAQDSWTEDFNGSSLGSGWWGNGQYILSQSDGAMNVKVAKSEAWKSFGVNIPEINITSNPVVNVKVKCEQPFIFTLWLFNDNTNININIPVMPSTGYSTVSFNFTGMNPSVLSAVKGIYLGVNGNGLSWHGDIWFDQITLGNDAPKSANFTALADLTYTQGTTGHKVHLKGIKNVSSFELGNVGSVLENISFSEISSDETAWMYFDAKAGVNTEVIATLTANGTVGYANKEVTFMLKVEDNNPPFFNNVADFETPKNVLKTIKLMGVDDGNGASNDIIDFTATSLNTSVIPNNFTIDYEQGTSSANISFTPSGSGQAEIIIKANDGLEFSDTILVTVLDEWNDKPTIDFISNMQVLNNAGEQLVELTGISDGGNSDQILTFEATSSDSLIVPHPTVEYTSGSIAILKFTPVIGLKGYTTITVKVTDDGGNGLNNGNQESQRIFIIETYDPPLTGYVIPFTGQTPNAIDSIQPGLRDYWYVEGLGTTQVVTHEQEGADTVFKIVCNGKSAWTGSWYYTPDMDLTDNPMISMWVKCDQKIFFHLYFWDESIRNNEDHHLRYEIQPDTWTKLEFNFSDALGMLNRQGLKVNGKRIIRVLFNYHPTFTYPTPTWSGTVWFKDVRIGDKSGIIPTYHCSVHPVGKQTYFKSTSLKTVNLKGVNRGKDDVCNISVTGKGVVQNLEFSSVVNEEAQISFVPSSAGIDTITVTVSGASINGITPISHIMRFPVDVVDSVFATPSLLDVNQEITYQVYRGLGSVTPNNKYIKLYTTDGFGASAVRIEMIGNQIEPLNDNEDDRVIDKSKLDYSAFDWELYRELKERGVETFILTIWTPPTWMKEGMSIEYPFPHSFTWGFSDNQVYTDLFDEYAELAVILVEAFKEKSGIELDGLGLQNEPVFCEPYGSAILGPEQFATMIAKVGERFEALGIKTKLYGAEDVGAKITDGFPYSNKNYLDAFNNNPIAKKYSDVFAVHGYAEDGISPGDTPGSLDWANTFAAINADGKARELWMTETAPGFTNWDDAFNDAANIHTAFVSGNVGLWTDYTWGGLCINQGKPTQKYSALSMFRYIRPGALRLHASSGHNDILISAWKNEATDGNSNVIMLINKGLTPLTSIISDPLLPSEFDIYRCSEQTDAHHDGNLIQGQKLLLAPRSIVTLVSNGKIQPTINQVEPRIVMIDAPEQRIKITGISDGNETNVNEIEIDFSLSSSTVIEDGSLIYTSAEDTAVFAFSPKAIGTVTVTLTVTADSSSRSVKFQIQVRDYTAPTIGSISDTILIEAGSGVGSVNITGISDGDDGNQTISVSSSVKTSSIPGVISGLTTIYTSPDPTGIVQFSPEESGISEVEVTVVDNGPDGQNTTSTTFIINVFDYVAPTIQAVDTFFVRNGIIDTLYLTLSSADNYSLLTTLTAESSNSTISGPVVANLAKSIVYFTPREAGIFTISVTLKDNGSEGKNTTVLQVPVVINPSIGVNYSQNEDVHIYPNPVDKILNLSVNSSKFKSYSIISIANGIIMQGTISSNVTEIRVDNLAPGMYFIKMEGNEESVLLKFIKN